MANPLPALVNEELRVIDQTINNTYRNFKTLTKDSLSIRYHRVHSLWSKKLSEFSRRYNVKKLTVLENCVYGVSVKIFYGSHEVLSEREEGPVNLGKINLNDIEKFEYQKNKNWGYGIEFKSVKNARGNYLKVYFHREKTRNDIYERISNLIPVCKKRRYILKRTTKNKNFENVKITDKDDFTYFNIPFKHTIPLGEWEFMEDNGVLKKYPVPYGIWPIRKGDGNEKIRLLNSGEEALQARLDLIRDAQKSIRIQSLLIYGDESGVEICERLIEKAKQGVKIQIVVDNMSTIFDFRHLRLWRNTYMLFRNMMAAGIEIYGYRPPHKYSLLLDELKLYFYFKKDLRVLNDRFHEKMIIGDDNRIILGGINIGDHYLGMTSPGRSHWRDQDIEVLGESSLLVKDSLQIFEGNIASYLNHRFNPKDSSLFNANIPGSKNYIDHFNRNYNGNYHTYSLLKNDRYQRMYAKKKLAQTLKESVPLASTHPSILSRMIQQRPRIGETNIEDSYIHLIDNAKEEIILSNAYLMPYPEMVQSLVNASKRHVKIYILTNSVETNDSPLMSILARYIFKPLSDYTYNGKTPLEIYEWTGRKGGALTAPMEYGTNHSKFMIVDKKLVIVGSYNLDARSLYYNGEIILYLKQPDVANELRNYFFNHDLQYAKKIDYSQILEWHKMPSILQSVYLKLKGHFPDESLWSLWKNKFLLNIALMTRDAW